jgi:hypothetical protein
MQEEVFSLNLVLKYVRLTTGPCAAKPWPASPNHHMDTTKEQSMNGVNQHNLIFLTLYFLQQE